MRRVTLFVIAVVALATFGITACDPPKPAPTHSGPPTVLPPGVPQDTLHSPARPPRTIV